jgi:hypothetical protein
MQKLIILFFSLPFFSLAAPFSCLGAMGSLQITFEEDLKGNYWIPELHQMEDFKKFQVLMPPNIRNGSLMTGLLKESPSFRKAITLYLTIVEGVYFTESAETLSLYNTLIKSFYNEGNSRMKTLNALERSLEEAQKMLSPLADLSNPKSLAPLLEKSLLQQWRENRINPIQSWVLANGSLDVNARSPSDTETPLLSLVDTPLSSIDLILRLERQQPLIQKGEVYNDAFMLSLLDLQPSILHLDKLLAALKKSAYNASQSVGDITWKVDNGIVDRNTVSAAIHGLLDSRSFYENTQEFIKEFSNIAESLIKLKYLYTSYPENIEKLRSVAHERVLIFINELAALEFNFSAPSPRYRSALAELGDIAHQLSSTLPLTPTN